MPNESARRNDTERSTGDQFQLRPPQLELPKGGGALRGVGEKFAANPVTGTGAMRVPIFVSPGRSGFAPQLALDYDSSAGNGPFGLGWHLSLPSISRKTDKGLPRYEDAGESDAFILSGAEDLVPLLVRSGDSWLRQGAAARDLYGRQYAVSPYRPRVEGLFARIECWRNVADAQDTFWRSISKENVTTWYGVTPESRIADPMDESRIFSWLLCETHDDKGNVIAYRYKPEDSSGVDRTQVHERNRTERSRGANRYVKRIQYGNATPYFPDLASPERVALPSDWHFEVVFDYGEHDADAPLPGVEVAPWSVRADPYSTYRATFELRCYRRCQRVLVFHHFPDEAGVGENCLVRSTDFTYTQPPADPLDAVYSFLNAVSQTGYRRQAGGYLRKSLPPVEFEYTRPSIDATVRDVDLDSLENLPSGVDGEGYQWVDLDGEGASGVLGNQGGAWLYKPNWSPANVQLENGAPKVLPRFGPAETMRSQPARGASALRGQLVDLAGDGHLDLVEYDGSNPGFYAREDDGGWRTFTPFASLPALDWRDPNLRFIDLTGDGFPDLLISENEAFLWMRSLAKAGFGPAQRVQQVLDEEKGPNLVLADGTESIFLADMSGDGLTDLVRIRNGEVCYWPNLGHGRFGAKVIMDHAPRFDADDMFDGRRIRLADIDGSGTTDIVHFGTQGTSLYFNLCGNAWSDACVLQGFPPVENISTANALDLLGTGTACLTWCSPLPGNSQRRVRYVELMSSGKPHLLVTMRNNLGAESRIGYAPSTRFYVADKLAGRRWITRIPFPVHVVERVETYDWISRNRFVTRYAYHHGHYDGIEREFCGFGMVEQWDTEEFAALTASAAFPAASNVDAASHSPPVHTKTWFHTGAYVDGERVSTLLADEYYREGDAGDGLSGLTDAQLDAMRLADTILPTAVWLPDGSHVDRAPSPEEARQACRALRGAMLRREVYADDGTDAADRPYSAAETNYTLELLQPQAGNRHAVLFAHARESIDFQYERKLYDVGGRRLADPRVSHSVTLDVDVFGNPLRTVAIGYGRRHPDTALAPGDQAQQAQVHVVATEREYTLPVDESDRYRAPLPAQSRSYELLKCASRADQPDVTNLFAFDELAGLVASAGDGAHDLPYEDLQGDGATADAPYRRLLKCARSLYRKDDLSGPLPLGRMDSLGLPYENYRQAYTPGLLAAIYGPKVDAPALKTMLEDEGGYRDLDGDGNYWACSGRWLFSPDAAAPDAAFAHAHFFTVRGAQDPFGNVTRTGYDDYDLLAVSAQDAAGNAIGVQNDYRVLQPGLLTDPNGNRNGVAFDALGLVAGSCVMGKVAESSGDSLADFVADLTPAQVDAFFAADDPRTNAVSLLGNATGRNVYDMDRFVTTRRANAQDPSQWEPAFVAAIARETHSSDLAPGARSKVQIAFTYSDGFGRAIQKKVPAEPATPGNAPRWVTTGWTIVNNKGKPVRQYEPYFSALAQRAYRFEFGTAEGVSPIVLYDPPGRPVAAIQPEHTWSKIVCDPWRQETWDASDTATIDDPGSDTDVGAYIARLTADEYRPTWYAQRAGGALGPAEQDAALKTAVHAATPNVAHADSLGRMFLTVAHNKFERNGVPTEEFYTTRVAFDVESNQRAVIDAKGRTAMRYDYDMLGRRAHQASMEAGERWLLHDTNAQPIYAWDSRGHRVRTTYDALRRPVDGLLKAGNAGETLIGRTVYGESQANAQAGNLRGKVFQVFDQAGVVASDAYDFKGNLLRSSRRLAREYRTTLDWSANPALEQETFTTSTSYDALNRPVAITAPDASVYRASFNEANLPDKIDVNLRGAATPTSFVANVDYDAKGRRTRVEYGNAVVTQYSYDPLTFRLTGLRSTRTADQAVLQDVGYAYDASGNITKMADAAQQAVYFKNQVVTADSDYAYDALYRLIAARAREHAGQATQPETTWNDAFRVHLPQPGDGQAMRAYEEQYAYDAVGNILQLVHHAANGNWTRSYAYDEPSLLEPGLRSNRLSGTIAGPNATEHYAYDVHGSIGAMAHLPLMQWDFNDRLKATSRQVVNDGVPETTYYVYDAGGHRVRKVTERQNGTREKERISFGAFEAYREYDGSGSALTLARETLHVMDAAQRVALVETRTQGSEAGVPARLTRYQLGNHLGSVSVELDDTAALISYEEHYPFGSTSYQAGRSEAEVSLKRYRFAGAERDEESGLYHQGARYSAPWLGRWVSADPLGLVDGTNLYRYTRDNPVCLTDPAGTDPPLRPRGGPFATGDHYKLPDTPNVTLPSVSGKNLTAVTINNLDAGHTERSTMDAVLSSPDYVDNGVVSVGAEIDRIVDLRIKALRFRYTNKPDAVIPVSSIDLHSSGITFDFIKFHGVIYPVRADGAPAINDMTTPNIIAGARMKLADRTQALEYREEAGWMIYAFSGSVALLGGYASQMGAIHGVGFSLGRRIPSRSPVDVVGGGAGGGASESGNSAGTSRWTSPVFQIDSDTVPLDVIVVETSDGRQGFYRSDGTNSGMPGRWLPFDEYTAGQINKFDYTQRPGLEKGTPLHRFGSEEYRSISDELTNANIPEGAPLRSGEHLNQILDFFNARMSTDHRFNRPVPDPTRYHPWP